MFGLYMDAVSVLFIRVVYVFSIGIIRVSHTVRDANSPLIATRSSRSSVVYDMHTLGRGHITISKVTAKGSFLLT
jgi:hypothetical protein